MFCQHVNSEKKHPLPLANKGAYVKIKSSSAEPKIKSSSVTFGRVQPVQRTGTHWGATRCFSQALLLCVGVMNPINDCSIFPSLAPFSFELLESKHHASSRPPSTMVTTRSTTVLRWSKSKFMRTIDAWHKWHTIGMHTWRTNK